MKIKKLSFANIRSFVDETKFVFETFPGLYFLTGTNLVDEDLGSNGAGKSTLWNVLCWILYGKTTEGLRAGDLHSWQSTEKGYWAELEFKNKTIRRTWRPNSLTIDDKEVEQGTVDDFIGASYDLFTYSVLLSQNGKTFLDLAPTEKMALFTSVLDLDRWLDYSAQAKKKADKIQERIYELEKELTHAEGVLQTIDLESLEVEKAAWQKERRKHLAKYKETRQKVSGTLSKEKKALIKLKQSFEKAKQRLRIIRLKMKEQGVAFTNASIAQAEAKTEVDTLNNLCEFHKKSVNKVVRLARKGKDCPVCQNKLSTRYADKYKKTQKRSVISPLLRDIGGAMQLYQAAQDDLREAESLWEELQEEEESREQILLTRESLFDNANELVEKHKRVMVQAKQSYQILFNAKRSPELEALLETARKKFSVAKKKKRMAKEKLRKLEKKLVSCKFWIKGFKDIRLFFIKEALSQLEIETNIALSQLSLPDWQFVYDVEKITKAGKITPGFNVLIRTPFVDEQVSFDAWSGGEKQRLKLAGSMGFINLISSRRGFSLGLEVYDEPTQHLSPEGIDDLVTSLKQRAMDQNKVIYFVDHHTLEHGGFDKMINIVKTAEGSHIES
ncbi:AAA family ATPase [Candidatus Pacearchaeota archaeon]|nr:AAA family ATPase [Candidatus Pacearchaeota archaeon]